MTTMVKSVFRMIMGEQHACQRARVIAARCSGLDERMSTARAGAGIN
jgi:hypothetical protein